MHRRKILYVIGSLEIGGAERHLAQLMVELKTRGWSPRVFTFKLGGPLTYYLQKHDIPIYGFSLPFWLKHILISDRLYVWITIMFGALKLLFIFWLRRPYIVHFFLPSAYTIGGLTSLFSLIPVKIMSRRSLNHYQNFSPFLTKIEYRLHKHMTLICGNSIAVMNNLEEEGIDASKLRLIYNGIDIQPYKKPFDRTLARMRAGIREDTLVFIIVANLIPYKGHADLISALSMIKNQLPSSWLLLCLGRDDGIGLSLKQQARTSFIMKNIQFLGVRNDVSDWLRIADVGILSSHQEGFSNSVLEGMAAGLPMIVTNVGGNAEAVLDGETGYVVPTMNPEQLSKAILKMALNPNRIKMGHKGKARVEKKFSMSACIDKYEKLYRECDE